MKKVLFISALKLNWMTIFIKLKLLSADHSIVDSVNAKSTYNLDIFFGF